ncbi:phosphotransferase [Paenibacillus filicis]|uniref:Phosphotransferase n=1 Tax=Paenibacillus gyeongsangnamensis TaxID=3388067 RepID=A0ABT4QEW3_9BACL|nr:phosphotransferase [Paenibacillus filicis]MCZ8515418.1 phosphotransferase [Paenibacillus filicis]
MFLSDEKLVDIISEYGISQPDITLIRHNENRTYKVTDRVNLNSYLFRIHQPVTKNLEGMQHRRDGLGCELQLLKDIVESGVLTAQTPVPNCNGTMISEIRHEDDTIYCSMLRWIDGRDLTKEDLTQDGFVHELGRETAKLHRFLRTYNRVETQFRPKYGEERIHTMRKQIFSGVEKGLFDLDDYSIVDALFQLIGARLQAMADRPEAWGIIHGDLNKSNILLTPAGCVFIDYSLFGSGYYLYDVAMGALNSIPENRNRFFEGYFEEEAVSEECLMIVEGFMLMSILGYFAFHMENESIHPWIKERMPIFCEKHARPFLSGERIIYHF